MTLAGAALLFVLLAPQPWLKGIAALVVLALALWDAEPWVYLAAFCIPFSFVRVSAGPLLFSPADVTVWAAFIGWAVRAIRIRMRDPGVEASAGDLSAGKDRLKPRLQPADAAVAFLLVSGALSLLAARDLIAGLDAYRLLILQPALLYLVIRGGTSVESHFSRIADAFVLGGAALALAGLWQYAGPGFVERTDGVRRLLVPFYDSPNHISLYVGRTAALALGIAAFAAQTHRRRWHAAAFGVMALAFFLTYSRAGLLLGAPAAVIVIAALRPSPGHGGAAGAPARQRNLLLAAAAGAALLALLALTTPRYAALLRADDVTAGSRLLIWRGAARMIADNPALGVGIGNFFARYPQYMLPEAWREPLLYHAHNVALDFWSMMGIAGMAAFIWLEIAFWQMALRLRRAALSPDMRALVIGLAAGMAYALAHGLVDTLYFLPDLALAFMLTLGLAAALGDRQDLQDAQDIARPTEN